MHRYQDELVFTLRLAWTCSKLWFSAVLMFWWCLVQMKQVAGCTHTHAHTQRDAITDVTVKAVHLNVGERGTYCEVSLWSFPSVGVEKNKLWPAALVEKDDQRFQVMRISSCGEGWLVTEAHAQRGGRNPWHGRTDCRWRFKGDIARRGRRTPGHAAFYLKLADAKELGKFEFVKEKVIPHPHLYINLYTFGDWQLMSSWWCTP